MLAGAIGLVLLGQITLFLGVSEGVSNEATSRFLGTLSAELTHRTELEVELEVSAPSSWTPPPGREFVLVSLYAGVIQTRAVMSRRWLGKSLSASLDLRGDPRQAELEQAVTALFPEGSFARPARPPPPSLPPLARLALEPVDRIAWLPWALAGAGVVSGAVGAGFALQAAGVPAPEDPFQLERETERLRGARSMAFVFLGLAVLMTLGAVVAAIER
ncbi:MAG: hypothetical protein HYV07_33065 [Deltaproteobacteria bacterium]|nr:hypothetical protein [Deltaproteobacteria bacterium]